MPITLYPHKSRVITFYSCDDKAVPASLFDAPVSDCDDFSPRYPTPFRKRDFRIVKKYNDVVWVGGDKGLFRYCENEKEYYDLVMYFSADRDLQDNKVLNFCGSEDEIWVRTETAVSHIQLKTISMEEKADMLREETLRIVDRKGMISHKFLEEPWNTDKPLVFNHCDNDGGFTAEFCIGEILHYAVLKREKGADHPDTLKVKASAIRALEACLLLMYVTGRPGFMSRSYITTDAPLPDDGLFLKRSGNTATVLETSASVRRGLCGNTYEIPNPEIPARLRHLFTDYGYTEDDIIFKCDTSSDEVTIQITNLYFAHLILGEEEKELDEMIKANVAAIVDNIISNGYEYLDFHGEPTCWAKWSMRYFSTPVGWGDGPLNGSELLMYLKLALAVCGNEERWANEYSKLIGEGYADMSTLHYDRAFAASIFKLCDPTEDIMYGDHMLSNLTYFMLHLLETDEELRKIYYTAWQSWRQTSVGREHHPIYDMPFAAVCDGDSYYDEEKIKMWFYRHSCSMIASGVSLTGRSDVATKEYRAGYRHTSYLLTPDERFMSKADRDPLEYKDEDSHGKICVEMCSAYTTAYWLGRYYGILVEGGNDNA